MKPYFYLLLLPCLAANCSGGTEFPTTPAITFQAITPRVATTPTDSIVVSFAFTDGDGNLGFDVQNNVNDVLYKILRNGTSIATSAARLPKITPTGTKKSIEGEISLTFSSFGLVSATTPGDSISYEIMIMDRDSTLSNTITTTKIWVRK
jgi:hypothetical protein